MIKLKQSFLYNFQGSLSFETLKELKSKMTSKKVANGHEKSRINYFVKSGLLRSYSNCEKMK